MFRQSIITVVTSLVVALSSTAASAQLSQQQGRFFRFVVPAGWSVDENPNALSLLSPDKSAGVQHIGIAGLTQEITPQQYVQHVLSRGGQNLQFIAGQPIQPGAGCKSAAMFEVAYTINGVPSRGIAIAHVAVGYQQCNAAMTIAACRADQWEANRAALTQMAMAVAPGGSGGDTYGARGVSQQNLNNSINYGRVATDYRNESNANWQAATNQRWDSQDRNNRQFRQNLGNATQYYNAYTGQLENYSASNATYWQNPNNGQVVAGDANFDPRTASDPNWNRMQEQGWQR